jgi:hypothetical protein
VLFNGEMKKGCCGDFFPSVEVVGAEHGGGSRPTGGDGLRALLWCGRRKWKASCAGWVKRLDGPAGRWDD